jgi:proline iminopeptidase
MLKVSGAQLFTIEVGDGPRIAVVLHGGPGASHDYLRPQLDRATTATRRLFYYDQRGGGRSPLDPGVAPGGIDEHIADLDAIRVSLGEERLTLIGYSFGGLLALLYALRHPERVERLALISPAPTNADMRTEFKARLAAAGQRPEVEAFRQTLDPANRRHRFALAVAGYFVDPRRALELTPFMVQQRVEEAIWRSLGDYDLRPELPALRRLPIFVAHGKQDPIPIEDTRELARLTGAELLELENCGHSSYIEAADQLFPPLRSFLDR